MRRVSHLKRWVVAMNSIVAMNNSAQLHIAADLGGTKIRAAVFDASLRPLFKTELASEAGAGKSQVLVSLENAITRTLEWIAQHAADSSISGVGVSTAGVVDSHNGVILDATDAIPDWRGTELAAWLRQRFGLPVAVENDVKCALLGELTASPELMSGQVVMLTLGTGLGGAISMAGRIVGGAHSVAGHFGRMPIPSPWQPGEFVSLEELVSGTGLANVASRAGGGRYYANGRGVLEAAAAGHPQALLGVDHFCDFLVMALEQVYWGLDPDVVLIGGGLVEAREHWWQCMTSKLAGRSLPITVRPAKLNNDAGVYGAGALIKATARSGEGLNAIK